MTGLSGGATPQAGEVAISMERMSGIEEIDTASSTATVLAGTPLQVVQQAAAEAGYLFPLDLGARGSCTIGGNIATNAGGNQVIRFGMMRNLVLGLEAVLADGTVVTSLNKMLKNNAGYDLKQLFIGTEGTLGIVTRAVLRLFPKLPSKSTALCALRSFDDAVALLHALQARLGGALSAFEAMWAPYFHYVVERIDAARSPFDDRHALYVLIELEGTDHARRPRGSDGGTRGRARIPAIIVDAAVAQSEREARAFWAIRDGIGEVTPTLQPLCAFDVSLADRGDASVSDGSGPRASAAFRRRRDESDLRSHRRQQSASGGHDGPRRGRQGDLRHRVYRHRRALGLRVRRARRRNVAAAVSASLALARGDRVDEEAQGRARSARHPKPAIECCRAAFPEDLSRRRVPSDILLLCRVPALRHRLPQHVLDLRVHAAQLVCRPFLQILPEIGRQTQQECLALLSHDQV